MAIIPIDLDIAKLRCFMEAAKTGSFTKAGKNIGLTQSGVSVKIRRLEERLSTQIFQLVLLPSPCSFRKIATEGLEKANRKWEVLFTGTSIANIQAAVQAGMGLSVLPKGALKEGLRKAPFHLELP